MGDTKIVWKGTRASTKTSAKSCAAKCFSYLIFTKCRKYYVKTQYVDQKNFLNKFHSIRCLFLNLNCVFYFSYAFEPFFFFENLTVLKYYFCRFDFSVTCLLKICNCFTTCLNFLMFSTCRVSAEENIFDFHPKHLDLILTMALFSYLFFWKMLFFNIAKHVVFKCTSGASFSSKRNIYLDLFDVK